MGTPSDKKISKKNPYDSNFLGNAFLEKIIRNEVNESVLDDKVRRILRIIYRTSLNKNRTYGSVNNKDHSNTAYRVATEGIVLLQNTDSFLPINSSEKITIAVIGENATKSMTIGGGSSELKANYEILPLEGIQNEFKNANILYSVGYTSKNETYEIKQKLKKDAILIAEQADVVLFIGGLNKNLSQDCENADRKYYNLPYNQAELIESNQTELVNSYALTAKMFGFKILYLEAGSGASTQVDPKCIESAREVEELCIIVGGGIRSGEQAAKAAAAGANWIVTGTLTEDASNMEELGRRISEVVSGAQSSSS